LEQVADFKSELAADFISEAVADLPRNQQPESESVAAKIAAGPVPNRLDTIASLSALIVELSPNDPTT
jgi:hypothetical protein